MSKKIILLAALCVGVGLAGYGFAQESGKNIRVLPKTMSKAEIKKLMKQQADALGVQCDFCHDTDDMSKDTPKKLRAREMMTMVQVINKSTFQGKDRVKCVTCHGGKTKPK